MSVRQNVISAKRLFGKMSIRQTVFRQNVHSANCLSAKCPTSFDTNRHIKETFHEDILSVSTSLPPTIGDKGNCECMDSMDTCLHTGVENRGPWLATSNITRSYYCKENAASPQGIKGKGACAIC